ncbi:hypothetical protein JCM10207_002416 [Rhodosporidiobolus poonsookiae]
MVNAPETQTTLGRGTPPIQTTSKGLPPRPGPSPVSSSNTGMDKRRSSSFFGTLKDKMSGRSKGSASASSVKTLVEAIAAPPPVAPDGLKDTQAAAMSDAKPTVGVLASLWDQIKNGQIVDDAATLFQTAASATGPINDREMLLEHLVGILQDMPTTNPLQQGLTDKLIADILWNDLPHSSAPTHVGTSVRAADGSGQNPTNPKLGAANTPYIRTVPPVHPKNPQMPALEVVFDALLKRDTFKPHPSGISSLLFSFATVIIHSAFQSGREDPCINEASSYLDLSPLYGNTYDEQKTVRSFIQGQLFPDVIASSRLFFMPPAVVALLVVFNRNHNYIADMLFKINEHGKYKPSDELDEAGKAKQDDDLFEKARLINCGWFTNIVVQDYVRTILNVNTTTSLWSLSPATAARDFPAGWSPRGVGNACSAEFNILYRWHSAISEKEEKWIEGVFRQYIGDKPFDELTRADFGKALGQLAAQQGSDPRNWTIPGIQRTASGRFDDDDLCRILTEATEDIAGAFGANGSPAVMKIIDVMGMATARNDWNVCTMNEFRHFLNLTKYKTFEDWNPDPVVAGRARRLYGHVDNLELFPGLHAEAAKPSGKGSGLAVNYTISRAILSDAVSLVRGDRFSTTDFNSANLTSWGRQDCEPDPEGGSFGGCIGKLLMRTLPHSYAHNSTYALFPFSTPETVRKILTENGNINEYSLERPTRTPPTHGIETYEACMEVLVSPSKFGTIYDEPIKNCSSPNYSYMIAEEGDAHRRDREVQSKALFIPGWQDAIRAYYRDETAKLIKQQAWNYDGKHMMLDVVRDVTNLVAVYWVSHQFGIPFKTAANPRGVLAPQELYLALSAFFMSVFMNFDLSAAFKLRAAAKKVAPAVLGLVRARILQAKGVPSSIDHLARHLQDLFLEKDEQAVVMGEEARAYYERLLLNDRPVEMLEASVQSTMTASVSNQGQAAAQVINFFLADANKEHKDKLIALCKQNTAEADNTILAYVHEALRFDPQVPLIPRVAVQDATVQDGDRTVNIKKGDFVYPSMYKAGMDPTVFPNPSQFDPTRDPSLYRLFGHGAHTCLGAPIVDITLVEMVKAVFSLPNVRRAPGKAGELVRFTQEVGGTDCHVYLSANATPWPLPVSLSVIYDAE